MTLRHSVESKIPPTTHRFTLCLATDDTPNTFKLRSFIGYLIPRNSMTTLFAGEDEKESDGQGESNENQYLSAAKG